MTFGSEKNTSAIRAYLESRIARDPADASSHRLLGRLSFDDGDVTTAISHFQRALELDPLSAATRFDLGRALITQGDLSGAAAEWKKVLEIAPDTEYAAKASQLLADLTPDNNGAISPVAYEIRDFPGPPSPDPLSDPLDLPNQLPLYARMEMGVLYNSNVALAPSSRQLAPGTRESFQFFVSPEIEWAAFKGDNWAVGPLFTGQFTLNEPNFSDFNLQSYTPGLFAEFPLDHDLGTLVPRLEYRFTLDEFEGRTFSRRHGVMGRLTALHDFGGATTGYLAVDQTDFSEDGLLPEVTSADGVTYATGIAHAFHFNYRWLKELRAGIDLDRLDSHGSDFAYWGAGLSGKAVLPIVPTVELALTGGWGYRNYDRYEFIPDRNEFIWRAGSELRKWFTPQLSAAAIGNYQLFDSNNPLFEADRLMAGIVMQYEY